MAKFTRMKPIFNGDGVSGRTDFVVGGGAGIGSGLRLTDVSLNLLHFNKRKLTRITDPTRTRILASLSSSSSKSSSSSSSSSPSSSSSANKTNRKEAKSNHAIDAIYEEILGDPEYESDDLSCFRGLVLDISYRPINVVCWKRAICLEFMAKADVLEYYDQTVNSPSGSFYIPAVLRVPHLLQVVKRRRVRNTLSRKNIISRDNFSCQYCSSGENLTIDHVLPISRGGEWTWENLVTACLSCNSKKGQKTLEEANMKLLKAPKAPKDYDIVAIPLTNTAIKMLKMRKGTPEEWLQYLAKPAP